MNRMNLFEVKSGVPGVLGELPIRFASSALDMIGEMCERFSVSLCGP